MTLATHADTACNACHKPILNRRNSLQTKCAPCVYKAANARDREKSKASRQAAIAERVSFRARKDAAKPRQEWARDAQSVMNRYVRLRDASRGCVSCDKPATWDGQWHASHFRSVGAATAVRFHLWNIHKSCSVCNNWKSGNLSEYEPRLRALIGDDKVDWLRTQNQRADYSIDYLKRLKRVFTKRANRLQRRLESVSQPA